MSRLAIDALLLRCAAQDEGAFNLLYMQTSDLIRAILRRKLDPHTEVEDAVQEVFIRVWTRADGFDPMRGSALTWIAAIAANFAIDQRRLRRVTGNVDLETAQIPASGRSAEDRLDDRILARAILSGINNLGPRQADAIKQIYLKGRSYRDLADEHAVPLNTMRTWLRRGLAALRDTVAHRQRNDQALPPPHRKPTGCRAEGRS